MQLLDIPFRGTGDMTCEILHTESKCKLYLVSCVGTGRNCTEQEETAPYRDSSLAEIQDITCTRTNEGSLICTRDRRERVGRGAVHHHWPYLIACTINLVCLYKTDEHQHNLFMKLPEMHLDMHTHKRKQN